MADSKSKPPHLCENNSKVLVLDYRKEFKRIVKIRQEVANIWISSNRRYLNIFFKYFKNFQNPILISNSTAIFQKIQNLPKAFKSKQTNKQNLANSVQDIWRETNRLSARKYIVLEYEFWLQLKTQCKDKILLNCRILKCITNA